MVICKYDKTFEGFLSVIFDAYLHKQFPERLIGHQEVVPMFAESVFTVITDEQHSSRVWRLLEKKLSVRVLNMIFYVWLSEDSADELLFRYIRKIIDSPEGHYETNFGDDDILKMQKIAQKVAHEALYLKQFVRFQKAADGIYFAPVSPQFNALPLAIEHFKDRFSDQPWVIYDTHRKYGYYWDLNTLEEISLDDDSHFVSGKLDKDLISDDEKIFSEIWKEYFKSLTIKERLNLRLQRQHMPKRFWKHLIEKE